VRRRVLPPEPMPLPVRTIPIESPTYSRLAISFFIAFRVFTCHHSFCLTNRAASKNAVAASGYSAPFRAWINVARASLSSGERFSAQLRQPCRSGVLRIRIRFTPRFCVRTRERDSDVLIIRSSATSRSSSENRFRPPLLTRWRLLLREAIARPIGIVLLQSQFGDLAPRRVVLFRTDIPLD
jgi:hypothetical protein